MRASSDRCRRGRFQRRASAARLSRTGRKQHDQKDSARTDRRRFAGAGVAIAQQTGIKRTPLQKLDFPAGFNTVTAIAEVPAGGAAGRHTHPGAETGYVLEGELELVIDGKPPMKIKAGESYQIPEGAVHDAKAGDKPFKVLGVYVVKAGEPLAKPAP